MYRFSLIIVIVGIVLFVSRHEVIADVGLEAYVAYVVKAMGDVPEDRKKLLDPIAKSIASELKSHERTAVIFVCTHNSRRSQFSQVWARVAATHFGLQGVRFASGGVEVTAANIRTVHALRRAGLAVKATTKGDNPIYAVTTRGDQVGCNIFSKIYSDSSNPLKKFVAVMCCGDADKRCPVVKGAVSRFALQYVDPKSSDDTPLENATYDERCRQIATEMFYLVSQVKKHSA